MTDLFTDQNTNVVDPNKNYLEELVGEGKKFKSVEDLARAKAEADAFIERLKTETNGLRDELKTRTTLDEVLDRLNKSQDTNSNASNQNNQNGENGSGTALKPEDLARMIDERVSQREQARRAQENLAEVAQKLTEAYGSNFATKLKQEADALGLSQDYVNNLAATAPKALFRLLGVDSKPPQNNLFTPPTNQVRSPGSSQTSGDRTKAYYDDLKKRDPAQYWNPSTQNQMHKDALRLGESFFT